MICFNPCFIGNCSHTGAGRGRRIRITQVSILVLLETALILVSEQYIYSSSSCFNPCFIGNCSHTVHLEGDFIGKVLFQSLFYWKLLSYYSFFPPSNCDLKVSILVLLETALILAEGRGTIRPSGLCFNPCFIGNCSHT